MFKKKRNILPDGEAARASSVIFLLFSSVSALLWYSTRSAAPYSNACIYKMAITRRWNYEKHYVNLTIKS